MMFDIKRVILILAAATLLLSSVNVMAEDEAKPEASADLSVLSKYIWRGYELSDDSIVIQPAAGVSYMGVGLSLWGNLDTDQDGDNRDESNFNETDLTLSYDREVGPFGLGVGYIYYGLDGVDDSEEIYFSASLNTILSPTVTIYREVAHVPAWYINAGISHSFSLPKSISLDLSGSVGYYYSDDKDFVEVGKNLEATTKKYKNFHDGLISASLSIPIGKYMSFTPMVAYSFPLTDESEYLIESSSYSRDSDFLYGGATLSIAF